MTANLSFITHSAETDPHKFAAQGIGDRLTQTGFAYAGRPEKTEDRAVPLWIEFSYRKIFDESFLNFFQIVVIAIKDLLCLFEIEVVLAQLIPRQVGNDFDITHDHRKLRT